jgi:hypothetical protein
MTARPSRTPLAIAGACAALLVCAATAHGSTVRIEPNDETGGTVVVYEAAAGEVNALAPWIGPDDVQLQEGVGSTGLAITPVAPCVSGQPGLPVPPQPTNFAHCPKAGVDLIAAMLGDEDDRFAGMIYTLPVAVIGDTGDDFLGGGSLDDSLWGDEGADTLYGDSGDDILDGGTGPDSISGGDRAGFPSTYGFDLADYTERTAGVTATLNGSADDGEAGEGDNIATDVEGVAGGSGADRLSGNSLANGLYGGDGNDTLDGGPGQDVLAGDAGDDVLQAQDGQADRVTCGDGGDTAVVDGADTVAADCETVQRGATIIERPPPITTTASDSTPPAVSLRFPRSLSMRAVLSRGVRLSLVCSERCAVKAELRLRRSVARRFGLRTPGTTATVVVGRGSRTIRAARRSSIDVRLTARARMALRGMRTGRLTLRLTATDAKGNAKRLTRVIRIVA